MTVQWQKIMGRFPFCSKPRNNINTTSEHQKSQKQKRRRSVWEATYLGFQKDMLEEAPSCISSNLSFSTQIQNSLHFPEPEFLQRTLNSIHNLHRPSKSHSSISDPNYILFINQTLFILFFLWFSFVQKPSPPNWSGDQIHIQFLI